MFALFKEVCKSFLVDFIVFFKKKLHRSGAGFSFSKQTMRMCHGEGVARHQMRGIQIFHPGEMLTGTLCKPKPAAIVCGGVGIRPPGDFSALFFF